MAAKKSTRTGRTVKSTKSTASKKSSTGKASVEKGRKFEETVADLYRLLGAEVVQNIEICQKKVDILATFRIPGSSREHRVIVECKNEKKSVNANQRVQAFKGLLEIARKTGDADSAEIVTKVPLSDQAKGFAKTTGVDLFTYAEKVAQLIDFRQYLKSLQNIFENGDTDRPSEPPLSAYYVDLAAELCIGKDKESIPVIDTHIHKWLRKKTRKQLAIFGEFGSGKSTLCQKIGHDLACNYLEGTNPARIPIILNLRDFIGKVKIDAFITSFLDQECGVANPKYSLFRTMNEAGLFLLIFDGFDEMAVKVDADILEANLAEIDKLAASPNSKIILTSRPEYFINIEEEHQALKPQLNVFRTRQAEYEPLRILPWTDVQIELFLQKRVALIKEAGQPWTFYRESIKKIPALSDLSQRPVLLDMIARTLPKLVEDNIPINLPNLYATYLSGEIRRQKIAKKREFLLTEKARMEILKHLAIALYTKTLSTITFTDALGRIKTNIKPPEGEQELYTREFLTNSFLIRRGNEYHFSHKSIMEYLVAMHLAEEIRTDTPDIFTRFKVTRDIMKFLKELEPDKEILWKWIYSTREVKNRGEYYTGGNACSLLCALSPDALAGKDLSGTDLTGADLRLTDLRETKFNGVLLKNGNLQFADFFEKDIADADFHKVAITVYYLDKNIINRVEREKFDQIMIEIFHQSQTLYGTSWTHSTSEHLCGVIGFLEDKKKNRINIKNKLNSYSILTAVYFDEYESMVKQYPEVENARKQGLNFMNR